MKKIDYLKLAIKYKLFELKEWVLTAFSITKEVPNAENINPYIGKLIKQVWGFSFINEDNVLEKIDDSDPKTPLYTFSQKLTIDSSWAINLNETIETTIGNLFVNHVAIIAAFNNKLPYQQGSIKVKKIEKIVASKLKDNIPEADRSTEFYYVDEYVKFTNRLQYLKVFSQLVTYAATRKTIQPAPGIDAFKKELITKYGSSLKDVATFAKFEKELVDYDEAYLKDDPANNKFLSGKTKNVARKKMFLTIGTEAGFNDAMNSTPITNSLNNGMPTDPESLTAVMNGLRSGSFSRGAETVKGGVSAKIILRAANNFKIKDTDCGTKLGIHRYFNKDNIHKLAARYIMEKGIATLVTTKNASAYIDKDVIVRSPMYCLLEGDNICKICAGTRLSQYPTGLTIPLTDISGIILTTSLKKMHGSVLSIAKLNLETAFS